MQIAECMAHAALTVDGYDRPTGLHIGPSHRDAHDTEQPDDFRGFADVQGSESDLMSFLVRLPSLGASAGFVWDAQVCAFCIQLAQTRGRSLIPGRPWPGNQHGSLSTIRLACQISGRRVPEQGRSRSPVHTGTLTMVHPKGSQVHVRRPKEAAYTALGVEPLRCGVWGELRSPGQACSASQPQPPLFLQGRSQP